jgi:hypothetical protein
MANEPRILTRFLMQTTTPELPPIQIPQGLPDVFRSSSWYSSEEQGQPARYVHILSFDAALLEDPDISREELRELLGLRRDVPRKDIAQIPKEDKDA